jgi:hypothetical protein
VALRLQGQAEVELSVAKSFKDKRAFKAKLAEAKKKEEDHAEVHHDPPGRRSLLSFLHAPGVEPLPYVASRPPNRMRALVDTCKYKYLSNNTIGKYEIYYI